MKPARLRKFSLHITQTVPARTKMPSSGVNVSVPAIFHCRYALSRIDWYVNVRNLYPQAALVHGVHKRCPSASFVPRHASSQFSRNAKYNRSGICCAPNYCYAGFPHLRCAVWNKSGTLIMRFSGFKFTCWEDELTVYCGHVRSPLCTAMEYRCRLVIST